MRQLLLDWGAHKPQTLDSFVIGSNRELFALLTLLACREASALDQRFVYFWGEQGAGKTHLLNALAATGNARYLTPASRPAEFAWSPGTSLYMLDDCEGLPPESQVAAFALYNQVRENGGALVAAGARAPAGLALREDLRTRLGWGLVYQLHGLTDEEKIDALTRAATQRGLSLSAGVLPYLLTHYRRDMPSLSATLDALDRYSLETKRPITLPLLRELLQLADHANPT